MKRGWWYSLSHLPVLQLARLVHSRWLALLFGMGFHWHCDCSPGFTLTDSTLALKLLLLAVLESGALLSSNLEEPGRGRGVASVFGAREQESYFAHPPPKN